MTLVYKQFIVARLNARQWATRKPLDYQGKDQLITVPRGFVTDFATVPQIFMSLFPSTGVYTLAAVIHDYLCTMLALRNGRSAKVNAVDTDGIFRRICREEGTPFVTRWALWTGVRWGALANPVRRPGWMRTAPLVILWTLVLMPGVLIAAVGVGLAMLWLGTLELAAWVCRWVARLIA